jgi:hypothetical protein
MANEFKHADVGSELSDAEWQATTTHIADNQTEGDMLYYHSGYWIRATKSTILSILTHDHSSGVQGGALKLDDLQTPDDNTDLNASISAHGLCPKGDNDTTHFLRGDVSWEDPIEGNVGSGPIYCWPIARSAESGTWVWSGAALMGGGVISNTSGAEGDYLEFEAYVDKGTYTIAIVSQTRADQGKVDVYVGGTEFAEFDLYSAGTVYDVRQTDAGNVISTGGLKTIKAIVHEKNALSSNYYARINGLALWRTA